MTLVLVSSVVGCAAHTRPASSPVKQCERPEGAIHPTIQILDSKAPGLVESTRSPAPTPPAEPRAAVDDAMIAAVTGATPDVQGRVVRVAFPRSDVPVSVAGWTAMPPFMGLTSWASFAPAETDTSKGPAVGTQTRAMVMGDWVLFEDEIASALKSALENGLEVTALHNHFLFDQPRVFFMHIGGEGPADQLAKGVRAIVEATKAVRKKSPEPRSPAARPVATPGQIDAAKLDAIFGVKGVAKDGLYKVVMGRSVTGACGCSMSAPMGVHSWAAFGGVDRDAVVDGDFAVSETELKPVLRVLEGAGLNVVAIHHHMVGERPRLLFVHYWGRGEAETLAKTLRGAADLTDWEAHRAQM
ncbi:MAG TPA: DUF1259 domain-containing protein [Polyangiaceae bacterium]|nr:DUF1259 domain-containing protein [Polyangiaceae bacterium]